jgi:hypothetical protein
MNGAQWRLKMWKKKKNCTKKMNLGLAGIMLIKAKNKNKK